MTRWIVAAITAALLLGAPANARTVIKLATFAPVNSGYHDILLDLAAEWDTISKGEVELRIYAGGVAGDESDMLRKMRVGQLQAATMTSGGLPDIDPDFRAFQVPLMFETMDEFSAVLREMRPTLDGLLARHGFRALGWTTVGWLHFFSRAPIRVPDDLRPQRIFVWSGADRFVETWRGGGFRPVQMPVTDAHAALPSGLIDAISAPPLVALANQWFPHVPYMSRLRWVPMLAAVVVTDKAWAKVPARFRAELAAATERAAVMLSRVVSDYSDEAVMVMQEHGLTVAEVTAAELDVWRREAREIFHPLIGDYINAAMVAKVQARIDAYRATN